MDHEQVKLSFFISDVLCGRLKWRALHHTPVLVVAVADSINEVVVALEQLPGPIPPLYPLTSLTTDEICIFFDNFSIYHWDDFNDKSKCFDYGDFVATREIEDNIGVDDGIVPNLMDNIPMRDYGDSMIFGQNWLRFCDLKYLIVIYKLKDPCLIQIRWLICLGFCKHLEHCSGENVEILHNHLKHYKLKM